MKGIKRPANEWVTRYSPIQIEDLTSERLRKSISLVLINQADWQFVHSQHRVILSSAEHKRYSQFRDQRLAARYFTAHSLLRRLLSIMLDDISFIQGRPFKLNDFGKPSLTHNSYGIEFNLSYAGNFILLGISPNTRLGVDIEIVSKRESSPLAAQIIMTDSEYRVWQSFDAAYQPYSFYRHWVRKESLLKALGTGLSTPPDQIPVGCTSNSGQVKLTLFPEQTFYFRQIDVDTKTIACMTTTTPVEEPSCYQLTPCQGCY